MRRCVDANESCDINTEEDFPTAAATQADWKARCNADRPFAWRGACDDGQLVLAYSTGYNGERRGYDQQGEFLAVIEFTDTGGAPCYGQGYWPAFPKCEAPKIVEVLCGQGDVGVPMSLWVEPQAGQ